MAAFRAGSSDHAYVHCVTGPVGNPGRASGFPDGDQRASIAYDFRRTYIFKPNSLGSVSFGFVPSMYGCVVMGGGGSVATTQGSLWAGFYPAAGLSTNNVNTSSISRPGLLGMVDPASKAYVSGRPIAIIADVAFSGSSMHNGGTVVISKMPVTARLTGAGAAGEALRREALYPQPVASASQVSGPARHSYSSRIILKSPEYQPYAPQAHEFVASNAADAINKVVYTGGATTSPGIDANINEDGHGIWYTYTGLDQSASITVSVRYCIQYAVDSSGALAPLAAPSPAPAAPGLLQRLFSWAVANPAAIQTAGNALATAVPATRPALTAAAAAYNVISGH